MTPTARYRHEFRVEHTPFWKYRGPGEWLQELWDLCHPDDRALTVEGASGSSSVWSVDVAGTDAALRWACLAFNQHAEQHPHDPTPAGEAERLEATLGGTPISLVMPVDGPLTVGELRHFLNTGQLHPLTRVVIAVEDGWRHVAEIGVPTDAEDTAHVALTLYPGGEFDSRDA